MSRPSAPRRLIINSDDFGFSPGVNRGIIRCLEEGLISSATIMVNNESGSPEALAYAASHPQFGFGLHLNLVWGRPIDRDARSLCDESGTLLPAGRCVRQLLTGAVERLDLEREIRAQIRVCFDHGVRLSHVDSHKHMHLFGAVHRPLLVVAREFGLRAFRLPRELMLGRARYDWKARLLRLLSHRLARTFRDEHALSPDHFTGTALMGAAFTEPNLLSVIRGLPVGTTELMVHTGLPEPGFREIDSYVEWREREIAVLASSSIRRAIGAGEIELTDFRRLAG